MSHFTGQRLSHCLLAVFVLATPLTARGDANQRVPVIDPNSLAEPRDLMVAVEALPLPAHTTPSAKPNVSPPRDFSAGQKRPRAVVRFAAPFDPTSGAHSQKQISSVPAPKNLVSRAPVIRVDGPIYPAQNPRSTRSMMVTDRETAPTEPAAVLPIVQLAAQDPISGSSELEKPRPSRTTPHRLQPTLASRGEPVLKLVEQNLSKKLAVRQPSSSASDLPPPPDESLTEGQVAEAEELEAYDLDAKPIYELSARITPGAGELPKNYASAKFVREGEITQEMGYSRTEAETYMNWEASALCYRPLYFQEINLERYGYKIPVIQPAVSAAHFFGRVPLLPYMMVSEGHFDCRYTLGHYRPGDYAPYSLYIPRPRMDASAAEAAAAAAVILVFP